MILGFYLLAAPHFVIRSFHKSGLMSKFIEVTVEGENEK